MPGIEPVAEGSLDELIGVADYEFDGEAEARASLSVRDGIKQPYGIVHGGAYATLAETVCSRATFEAFGGEMAALGQANETLFLKAIHKGTIHARARALHRGRSSWVWDVEMSDDDGRLCATSRLIIAVRPMRDD
jgi:1,4-dihydroxy-2-naphthoyl-CoA hydrolase